MVKRIKRTTKAKRKPRYLTRHLKAEMYRLQVRIEALEWLVKQRDQSREQLETDVTMRLAKLERQVDGIAERLDDMRAEANAKGLMRPAHASASGAH